MQQHFQHKSKDDSEIKYNMMCGEIIILILPIMVSDIGINTTQPFWTVTVKHYAYTMLILKLTYVDCSHVQFMKCHNYITFITREINI